MHRRHWILILAILGWALWGDTVLVETIGDVPDLGGSANRKELLAQMETGVMDALFDGGHLFFSMASSSGGLAEENTRKSLMQSRNSGAQWLIRLIPQEGEIGYHIYEVGLLKMRDGGSISRDDLEQDLTWEQFYFEAGKLAGRRLIALIGMP